MYCQNIEFYYNIITTAYKSFKVILAIGPIYSVAVFDAPGYVRRHRTTNIFTRNVNENNETESFLSAEEEWDEPDIKILIRKSGLFNSLCLTTGYVLIIPCAQVPRELSWTFERTKPSPSIICRKTLVVSIRGRIFQSHSTSIIVIK